MFNQSDLVALAPNLFVLRRQIDVDVPEVSYPKEFFENNYANLSNFWIERRNRNIERTLRKLHKSALLEIGSGHGAVAQYLHNRGFAIQCVEPQIEGAIQTARCGIRTLLTTTPTDFFRSKSQEVIGIFDVLEHIESEENFLKMICDLLSPTGFLIVTVPSGNWLFSQTDIALGHQRRYSRKRLRDVMSKAGFEEVDSRYLFLLLVPFAFVFRAIPYRLKIGRNSHKQLEKISDVLDSKTIASRIVGYLSRIEEKFDQCRLIPYGLSIYSVYRPKDSGLIEDDIS